jgi:hypothetical protein
MSTNIEKLMKFLPEDLIQKQVMVEWRAKTKILNDLPKNNYKIPTLITPMTKTIKYKGKTINKHLEELARNEETLSPQQKEFIKYFQEEYVKETFQKITGKKYLKPKQKPKKRRFF